MPTAFSSGGNWLAVDNVMNFALQHPFVRISIGSGDQEYAASEIEGDAARNAAMALLRYARNTDEKPSELEVEVERLLQFRQNIELDLIELCEAVGVDLKGVVFEDTDRPLPSITRSVVGREAHDTLTSQKAALYLFEQIRNIGGMREVLIQQMNDLDLKKAKRQISAATYKRKLDELTQEDASLLAERALCIETLKILGAWNPNQESETTGDASGRPDEPSQERTDDSPIPIGTARSRKRTRANRNSEVQS